MIFRCFCLAVFASLFCSAFAQKGVQWIHGTNSTAAAWDEYETLFAPRSSESNISYPNTVGGVAGFAGDVIVEGRTLPNSIGPNADVIGIGHSQGALALRLANDLVVDNQGLYGGVITVGGVNRGAPIIGELRNGNVERVLADGVRQLTAGPRSEPLVYLAVGAAVIVRQIRNGDVPDLITNGIVQFGNGRQQLRRSTEGRSFDDMLPGSGVITTLNADPTPIPTISIFGTENSPVHWRLAGSAVDDNEEDDEFLATVDLIREVYSAVQTVHTVRAIASGVGGIFQPWLWALTAYHSAAATQWRRGKIWIDQSETIWTGLIGCNPGVETVTIDLEQQIVCNTLGFPGSDAWNRCIIEQCNGSWFQCPLTPATRTFPRAINEESDGLLCDQTQIVPTVEGIDRIRARGVNHFEETNTTGLTTDDRTDVMRELLTTIFDRDDGVWNLP